jgi:F-type H+-transporting ATPase subunit delta
MIEITIARRYSHALLNSAQKANIIDETLQALLAIKQAYLTDKRFREFIDHPRLPRMIKKQFLSQTIATKVPNLIIKFFELLIDKKRTHLIPQIADCYCELADILKGIVKIVIEYKHPIEPQYKQHILKALSSIIGNKRFDVEENLNPELIGGIKIRFGNAVIDGSIKKSLKELKESLLGFYSAMKF